MNKKLLFILCNVAALSYACDRGSSTPVSFLDMCTMTNQREENQDRRVFCRLPNKGFLFGVLDGHGHPQQGHEVAEEMSRTFYGDFSRHLKDQSLVEQAFKKAFCDAESNALRELDGGSTALFIYIKDGTAHVANVGDSRAVFGNKNSVAFATQDHKPEKDDEKIRIERAGGYIFLHGVWRVNGLAVSRSIGDRNLKDNGRQGQIIAEPEYTQVLLMDAYRWLVMATDGLWDTVSNEEAIAIVEDYYDKNDNCLNGVSSMLCDYAIHKGSKDNITVLVVDLLEQIGGKKVS